MARLIIGCGFLGKAVARLWVAQGLKTFATSRKIDRFDELRRLHVEPVLWDVIQCAGARLPQCETVLYCVGFDRSAGAAMRTVYVDGLAQTIEQLAAGTKLVYASSTGVYGDFGGEWVDESSPAEPMDEAGRACLAAEAKLTKIACSRSLTMVILRFAGLYGPGRLPGIEALRRGQPIAGNPDAFLNLIHVEDAAAVVAAASSQRTPNDMYLVSDGAPPTRKEFYAYLAGRLATPPAVFTNDANRRARGSRRISNARMLHELGVSLRYRDFRAGIDHAVSESRS